MTNETDQWQQGLAAVESAFPQRTVRLKNAGDGGALRNLVIGILLITITVLMFYQSWNISSEFLADRKLIDNYVILEDADISGECKMKNFLQRCDVQIKKSDGTVFDKEFFYISTDSSDQTVEIIAQKDDPDNVSIDLALNVMGSRMITLALIIATSILFLVGGILILLSIIKKTRLKKIMNAPENKPWKIVAVPVKDTGGAMKYETDIDGKNQKITIGTKGVKPLAIGESTEDKTIVLAIRAKNSNTFLPLNNKFRGLDLNKSERNAIRNSIKKYF